jgi:dienelactone hydrolase
MRLSRVILIAACGLALVAWPADGTPAPPPSITATTRPYAEDLVLDEYMPAPLASDSPVVVLVHGCCGDRRDMAGLARALARRGAVVLNADVHRVHDGGGWPASYHDVVCAVSSARERAARLTDRSHSVALVGWSDGALLSAAATLGWRELAADARECTAPVHERGPDLLVGIGGYYGWTGPGVPRDLVNDQTVAWFGAPPTEDPRPWNLGNPMWWLHRRPAPQPPPVHLIAGRRDSADSVAFWRQLVGIGADASIETVDTTSHLALVQPRGEEGAGSLILLCEALGLPRSV